MNASEMSRLVVADDVQVLYGVVLGRRPETLEVVKQYLGHSLFEVIANIMRSQEARDFAQKAVTTGRLSQDERLSGGALQTAAEWLSKLEDNPVPDFVRRSWWSILNGFLALPALERLVQECGLGGLKNMAYDLAREEARLIEELAPILKVDEAWCRRVDPDADIALSNGAYSNFAEYFLDRGLRMGKPLLAAFTEGLQPIYAKLLDRPALTLNAVVSEIISAALAGEVSHWLFSSEFYRAQFERCLKIPDHPYRRELTGRQPDQEAPYINFLLLGDRAAISPHPLFSHFTYFSLGGGSDAGDVTPFMDYIRRGCFSDRRTSVLFDPAHYFAFNPAARISILEKKYVSSLHHFLCSGILYDSPFSPDFEPHFYITTNEDVQSSVKNGGLVSPSWHFVYRGLGEGRMPNPYFDVSYYRRRYPLLLSEMRRHGIASELEHFLLIGRGRNYKANPPLVSRRPDMDDAKAIFQRRARRSWSNLKSRPLDFRPLRRERPDMSIIIPVFNEIEFTSRAIECAYYACVHLLHAQNASSEVIIVDNGSSDGTSELFSSLPGLSILRYEEPIGFPRAVNAGALNSSGEIIIVANNDIEFGPDIFANIRERLIANSTIGVIGGLTILPNETLQEAGSFVDSTGGTIGLGRGEDPWDLYFSGLHPVDYCTGSLIGFRRSDFTALDGFDEAFSPGYYEETDFCFRMREQLNKVSVIDSRIQLNHFEHASFGKGRPPATAATRIKQNKERFVGKHRAALDKRPAPTELVQAGRTRPAPLNRVRLLFIEDLIPDSRLGSGFPRVAQIINQLLHRGVGCEVLALHANETVDEFHDNRVTVHRGWMPGQEASEFLRREASRFSHIVICRAHNLARYGALLESLRHEYGLQLICDTEALSITRLLEQRRLVGEVVSDGAVVDAVRLEFASPARISQWIAVTVYEKSLLEAAGFGPVSVLGHRHDRRKGSARRNWAERGRLIAVGSMHELGAPNHDGLLWFLDHVYPRCGEAAQALTLTTVGYWSPEVLKSMTARYDSIHHLGVVSEARLADLYGESRVALAPTRYAAGLPLKAAEAMAEDVPVVMTDLLERQMVGAGPVGASGLAVGRRDDSGVSFADWVDRLASDEAVWKAIRERQYGVVEPHIGAAAFDAGLDSILPKGQIEIAPRPMQAGSAN